MLSSGMALIVAMARAGIRNFWSERGVPRVRVIEVIPVLLLLLGCAVMTVQAGPFMRYMENTAASLHTPQHYVHGVLSAMPVSAPVPAVAGESL